MARQTQCDKILRYMQEFGSITDKHAYNVIRCRRLSARIFDLKKQGHKIETAMVYKREPDGTHYSFAEYRLMDGDDARQPQAGKTAQCAVLRGEW